MFKNNCYVTIWKLKDTLVDMKDKLALIRCSTSAKNKDGNYETDFSDKVAFVGKAFEKVKELALNERDRLKLTEVAVRNHFDKTSKVMYVNYYCFDFEPAEKIDNKPKQVEVVGKLEPIDDTDNLPF